MMNAKVLSVSLALIAAASLVATTLPTHQAQACWNGGCGFGGGGWGFPGWGWGFHPWFGGFHHFGDFDDFHGGFGFHNHFGFGGFHDRF